MELLNNWINGVNDILWSYILIIMLLGCAVWFTIKSRFVQFRMIGEMIRLLGDSAGKGEKGENFSPVLPRRSGSATMLLRR